MMRTSKILIIAHRLHAILLLIRARERALSLIIITTTPPPPPPCCLSPLEQSSNANNWREISTVPIPTPRFRHLLLRLLPVAPRPLSLSTLPHTTAVVVVVSRPHCHCTVAVQSSLSALAMGTFLRPPTTLARLRLIIIILLLIILMLMLTHLLQQPVLAILHSSAHHLHPHKRLARPLLLLRTLRRLPTPLPLPPLAL